MATPSFAECWTQLTNLYRVADTLYLAANTNSANYLGAMNTLEQSLEGDYLIDIVQGVRTGALAINSAFNSLAVAHNALMLTFGKLINEPRRSASVVPQSLYNYFIDNSLTALQINYTRGAVSASGNVGNGTAYALTTDAENYAIEEGTGYTSASIVTNLRCIADKTSGARAGAEVFRVHTNASPNPAYPFIDKVGQNGGTSRERQFRSLCKEDATTFLRNPGFQEYNSGDTHPFPGWLSTSGTTYTGISQDTTSAAGYRPWRPSLTLSTREYYQAALGATSTTGLKQYIGLNGRQLRDDVPYFIGVRWYGDASANGNVVLKLGDYDASPLSVSVSAANSWNLTLINASTARNAWFRRFNQDDLCVAVERASHNAGTVYIDAVFCEEYDYFLGRWIKIVSGTTDWSAGATGSPNKRGDLLTFTDTTPSSIGTSQFWFKFFTGSYLPHADANTATQADYA
jgi:hypothetical protein